LCGMGYRTKSVHIEGNTGKDAALKIVQQTQSEFAATMATHRGNYIVVTIHRAENIYNQQRMKMLCDAVKWASVDKPVVFVLHGPTLIQLKKYSLFEQLSCDKNIKCIGLQPYDKFIKLMIEADCVMTDGGSIQEECSYFNIPCIILRSSTERDDGLGRNAILASYDMGIVEEQLNKISAKDIDRSRIHKMINDTSKKISDCIIRISNSK